MKILKCLLLPLCMLTLSSCGDGSPSDSIVETEVLKHVTPMIPASVRDSLEFEKSTCAPREEEGVWRCVVTLQFDNNGTTEKNTMSYILTKSNGAWFVRGPKPVSPDERNAAEGTE